MKSTVDAGEFFVNAVATIGDKSYDREVIFITYDHIPVQTVLRPNSAKFTKLNVITKGKLIGYLMGAGDEVPSALRTVREFEVKVLADNDVTKDNLKKFDAIVTGIRVYNTNRANEISSTYSV